MTKAELVSKIAEKTGVEKLTTLAVVESMMQEIKSSIENNESVFLRGFENGHKQKKINNYFGLGGINPVWASLGQSGQPSPTALKLSAKPSP